MTQLFSFSNSLMPNNGAGKDWKRDSLGWKETETSNKDTIGVLLDSHMETISRQPDILLGSSGERTPAMKFLTGRLLSLPNHTLPSLYPCTNQLVFQFCQDLNSHPPSPFPKSGSHLLASWFFSPMQT